MILIRRAEPNDAAGIAHVHVQSWRSTYRGIVPDSYLDELNEAERAEHWLDLLDGGMEVYVAERAGEVIGFATGGKSRDSVANCDAELYAIYLLEEDRRTRIGSDLLRELARALSRRGFHGMEVWVLARNPAKGFYERMGAEYAGTKEIEIGGATLVEQAYVWPDLGVLCSAQALSRW
jgi:ribosomal protein S18 acetylase RimI-like enzyme